MYSKSLILRRNQALKQRYVLKEGDPSIQGYVRFLPLSWSKELLKGSLKSCWKNILPQVLDENGVIILEGNTLNWQLLLISLSGSLTHDLIVIGITLGWLSKIFPFRVSVMWQKRIGQLVNRQVSAPGFLVAVSSVIFRIQKNYHMATRFWKNDFYTYYDLIVNPTAPDLYIHLGWVIFRTTKFFSLSPISMTWTLPFRFSQISGVFTDSRRPVFLNYFRAGWWIRNGKYSMIT